MTNASSCSNLIVQKSVKISKYPEAYMYDFSGSHGMEDCVELKYAT